MNATLWPFYIVRSGNNGHIDMFGTLTFNGTGTPSISGSELSVSRTTTGVYKITIPRIYANLRHVNASFLAASGKEDLLINVVSYTASTRAIFINVFEKSASALVDPSSSNSAYIELSLQD